MDIINKLFNIDGRVKEQVEKSFSFSTHTETEAIKTDSNKYVNGSPSACLSAYESELYIYGCVWLISNIIASLPLQVYSDNKKTKKIDNSPFYDLINKPNFRDSKQDILELLSANILLSGNTYLLLDQLVNKKPTMIFCLNSGLVSIEKNNDVKVGIKSLSELIKGYKYGEANYKVEEILHEKNNNPNDDLYGLSPIKAAGMTIATVMESKAQNYNIFKNGMNVDGSLESDQQFNEVVHKRMLLDNEQKYAGTKNAHRTRVLWNGLKYKSIGINPRDIEYIQGLKLGREDICGFLYQVPVILLGVLENASYNNIKEAKTYLYEFSIKPRLSKMRELFQKLLDIMDNGKYVDFDLSGVDCLQENISDKITSAVSLFNIGIPLNKIIEHLKLPFGTVPGGDTGYIPFSLMPIGTVKPEPVTPAPVEEPNPEKSVTKKIEMTEKQLESKWKKFISDTEPIELAYNRALVGFFRKQEKEVISNLNKYKSFTYKKLADKENTFMIFGDIDGKFKAINIDNVIFDYDEETNKLKKLSKNYHREALITTGKTEMALLNTGIAFDITNPRTVKWLEKYGLEKAQYVIDNKQKELKATLI